MLIRPCCNDDMPYVYSTWIKSYRPTDLTANELHNRIDRLLAANASILIATPDEATSVILGWLCFDSAGHIHYVYVRDSHRHQKIATTLIEPFRDQATPLITTHLTPIGRFIAEKHAIELRKNLIP